MQKTNAMRMLDGEGVAYSVHTYSDKIRSGLGVSEATGVPPERVLKTLVVMSGRNQPALVMVPADRELSLKRLGVALGDKGMRMATKREAEKLTGLRTGGISALELFNRRFPVFIERSVRNVELVLVSAGRRGVNLLLATSDLIRLTSARFEEVVRPGGGE